MGACATRVSSGTLVTTFDQFYDAIVARLKEHVL